MKKRIKSHKYSLQKNINLLIFSILLLFLGFTNLFSAGFVSIQDTTLIHSGTNSRIPVYSNVDFSQVNNAKFTFKFNGLLLNIKGVYAAEENGCKEAGSSFTVDLTNLKEATLEVTATQFNPTNNGILFSIELETLAGQDSIAFLTPSEITLNDVIDNSIELKAGRIKIGLPVYLIINEGIQEVYPNPFYFNGTVNFSIRDDSKINFKVYSLNGKLIGSIPGNDGFKSWFYDKSNNLILILQLYIHRGYYKFIFEIIDWKFIFRTIFPCLETVHGTYETKLLLQK